MKSPLGQPLAESASFRALRLLVRFGETREPADFALLIRHWDVQRWLVSRDDELKGLTAAFDRLSAEVPLASLREPEELVGVGADYQPHQVFHIPARVHELGSHPV